MALVTSHDLQNFNIVQRGDPTDLDIFVNSALEIVEGYLGYNLELETYLHTLNGNGRNELQLRARPIREILRVAINGRDVSPNGFECINEFIYYDNGIFPIGNRNIRILYTAGFEDPRFPDIPMIDGGDSTNDTDDFTGDADASTVSPIIEGGDALLRPSGSLLPDSIKITILRIAALLENESGGNIGITGNSFENGGTRTFVNYTNFGKFLHPISNHRLRVS